MHASIFRLDLGCARTARDRWRASRALATALDAVHGFVAFLAIEDEDGAMAGLCIYVDAAALEEIQRAAEDWQREHGGQRPPVIQPLMTGEVIAQRGL